MVSATGRRPLELGRHPGAVGSQLSRGRRGAERGKVDRAPGHGRGEHVTGAGIDAEDEAADRSTAPPVTVASGPSAHAKAEVPGPTGLLAHRPLSQRDTSPSDLVRTPAPLGGGQSGSPRPAIREARPLLEGGTQSAGLRHRKTGGRRNQPTHVVGAQPDRAGRWPAVGTGSGCPDDFREARASGKVKGSTAPVSWTGRRSSRAVRSGRTLDWRGHGREVWLAPGGWHLDAGVRPVGSWQNLSRA